MKKIIVTMFLVVNFLYADYFKMSLVDFIDMYKIQTKKNFIIDENVANSNIYLVFEKNVNNISISEFSNILKQKKLKLYAFKNYYYIDNIIESSESYELFIHHLKYNSYSSVKDVIESYVSNAEENKQSAKFVSYIKTTNAILFLCKKSDFNKLLGLIKDSDKDLKSALLKITISETNTNDLVNKGFKYKNLVNVIDEKYLKSYLSLFSVSLNESYLNADKSFYQFIDFLSEKNITNIKASPFLNVKNGESTSFSIVENIPYLTKNEKLEGDKSRTTSSYSYKDVGLKILIKPTILGDSIDLDLDIAIEDIIDNNSLTPKTSKKKLKGIYTLKNNEILILSGINKTSDFESRSGIPILKDIPFLKYLFSWKSKSKINTSLLITIEYIKDKDNISNNSFSADLDLNTT